MVLGCGPVGLGEEGWYLAWGCVGPSVGFVCHHFEYGLVHRVRCSLCARLVILIWCHFIFEYHCLQWNTRSGIIMWSVLLRVLFVFCSLFVCSFVIPTVLSVCTVSTGTLPVLWTRTRMFIHTLINFLYDIINVSNLVERGRRKKSTCRKEGSEGRKNRRDERRQATWEFYFFP